ncbi:baseplate J/gp47 family protein [Acetobacter aceti]|uniref:Baseplate protein J-like barrel domain-containing protein n=1 Tax=Acetobacter aceti TaxID=435 RepID=A0A6S6PTL3_ACEAC|nr:baseplate J/gp47 family protein [Acetobacter aceti]BCI68062.1 hypothetical protein AAJCM20276_26860 [Acetobacter aceti]
MTLQLRNFDTLVSNAVTAAQGACASLLSVGTGTPLRAILESVSAMGLWFQYQLLLVNAKIYLSTSTGTDIDSWVGQFGMTRMAGTAATGSETFTSFTPDQQSATIAVGATVKTDTGLIYAVIEDSSNEWWSASVGAYIRPQGTASITVPVQCQTTGTAGNVDAGAICLLGTSISGIDTCTNGTAFVNGSDGETDAALKARFPLWLSAKATASTSAIENAIVGTQTNLTYSIMDGEAADQTYRAGFFTAAIDDGTGDASDALVTEVYAAIDAVRACGVGFSAIRSSELLLTVSMTITVPAGTDTAAASTAVRTAITADIDAQTVGAGYSYARLPVVAWNNAGVAVTSITDVLLNDAQADIPGLTARVVRAGTVTINVVTG